MKDADLWRRIEAAPLLTPEQLHLPGTWRLFSKPLPIHIKMEIILEFKRFLYLLATYGEPLTPSPYVAAALTSFVPLGDKTPMSNILPSRLRITARRSPLFNDPAYLQTRRLRAAEFGPEDPEHIWPGPLSLALQWIGWGCLALGFALAVLSRLGAGTGLAALPMLAIGGFFWGTEGPWPSNLPIRKVFMARLVP